MRFIVGVSCLCLGLCMRWFGRFRCVLRLCRYCLFGLGVMFVRCVMMVVLMNGGCRFIDVVLNNV